MKSQSKAFSYESPNRDEFLPNPGSVSDFLDNGSVGKCTNNV